MRKLLLSFTLIATLSITPILASADVADTTAPIIESINLSPTILTSSGGELTIEFIVSDEGSGLADTDSNGAKIPSITFKLRNSEKTFSPANAAIPYKGDPPNYASYRAVIAIPSTLANGTWELFINPLRDQAGNSTTQISTGLTFLLGLATAAPTSPAPAGGSSGSGASAPTSPETPLPTPSATATATIAPTPIASLTPTPKPSATPSTVFATPSPTPSATKAVLKKVASKKKTISCRKGKLIKKVTGINPKCPKGYK
ncbi:MAG: hypothetical protein F2906_06890 [Actinobacteria bacterium]|nr:hypothetical protein [Actinomycetota bacterium]MSV71189.1 hypothetical protein [Actinomycetota bacterium]MSW13999.1 hypothetical protein [Actinomycetota bacterium]MSX47502.1 hypothetical protein [Actinomycetota bacterium]MSX91710.1 hypothetical protein [Actinomycetota bacterium]